MGSTGQARPLHTAGEGSRFPTNHRGLYISAFVFRDTELRTEELKSHPRWQKLRAEAIARRECPCKAKVGRQPIPQRSPTSAGVQGPSLTLGRKGQAEAPPTVPSADPASPGSWPSPSPAAV